jgi:glycosyltransferase involved in cell wall biosynthesis
MIYLDLPTGGHHGWGICGDNLSRALAELTSIERLVRRPQQVPLPGPLLQSVNARLAPDHEGLSSARSVAYAMFENDVWATRVAAGKLSAFDAVATACQWGEECLRRAGVEHVVNIPQGIDPERFSPSRAVRRRWLDRFVVFSGGKFEFRKGQDVALRAFQIFADRHDDALLVTAWHNPALGSAATMRSSPYWPFEVQRDDNFADALGRWMIKTGIDPARVCVLTHIDNCWLPEIYGNTDIGLFPNRCEGATNLVMMEYMACGRPTIATAFAGHLDIVTDANCFPLRSSTPLLIWKEREPVACWCEPDLDEVLATLEFAYAHRDESLSRARQAAATMTEFTWEHAARKFLQVLQPSTS